MTTRTGYILEEVKNFAVIPHVCSTNGSFDTPFAKRVDRIYPNVKSSYYKAGRYVAGEIQPVRVASRLIIINMICLEGSYSETNVRPLALHHLKECLFKVKKFAENMDLKVHIPMVTGVCKKELESISKIISEVSSDFIIWETPKKEVAEITESVNLNQILKDGTAKQISLGLSRKKAY